MTTACSLTIVLRYRRANTYGLHVLLGALETDLRDQLEDADHLQVVFANDVDQTAAAILSAAREGRTSLVCWSFYSPDFRAATTELHEVRARTAGATGLHLAGGPHATAEPEATLAAGFDAAAIGESEHTFVALVGAMLQGSDPSSAPGLALRRSDREGVQRTGPAVRHELDRYPAFSRHFRKINPIEITRGCIYACKFCQTPFMFKARFRHRSVKNVRDHVRFMKSIGLTDVRFITPTSLSYGTQDEQPNLVAVEELLGGVRDELGDRGRIFFGSFPSEVRPEHVTADALRLLKGYVANDNLIIGAQSGSERILRESGRGHNVETIVNAVKICLQEGFRANVDFIFGMPGEDAEDAMASIALAEALASAGARIHGHTFMPLPGTPWRHAKPELVTPEAMRALKRLMSSGKLYGSWQKQQTTALELIPLSTDRRRRN
jgi:B12-binding domain/radical SAM domain protein